MRISDWSSDVCSSDLLLMIPASTCVSIPRASPRAMASLTPTMEIPNSRLLQILAICPVPTSPQCRSEERRVGKECVRTCKSRCSPDHEKKYQELLMSDEMSSTECNTNPTI